MDKKEIFIENLFRGSGAGGLKVDELKKNLESLKDVDFFVYSLKKAFQRNELNWLNCDSLFDEEIDESWSYYLVT